MKAWHRYTGKRDHQTFVRSAVQYSFDDDGDLQIKSTSLDNRDQVIVSLNKSAQVKLNRVIPTEVKLVWTAQNCILLDKYFHEDIEGKSIYGIDYKNNSLDKETQNYLLILRHRKWMTEQEIVEKVIPIYYYNKIIDILKEIK
jgi:hypothetical protein